MNKQLDALIDRVHPALSVKSRALLSELAIEEDILAGTQFIELGQVNNAEYFVLEGVVRSFMINEDGDQVTIAFYPEDYVLSPHVIRTQDERSILNFEAITACKLLKLDAGRFSEHIRDDQDIQDFANMVLRGELIRKVNKEIQLISQNSKERLIQFRKDFHMLENRVPHSMIASYLGITPVSLSRLRKSLSIS